MGVRSCDFSYCVYRSVCILLLSVLTQSFEGRSAVQGACSEALDVPAADSARMEIASRLDTGRASVCGCVAALSIGYKSST